MKRKDLRNVVVYVRDVLVEDDEPVEGYIEGKFHEFVHDRNADDENEVHALIETINGDVLLVPVESIQFMDAPEFKIKDDLDEYEDD